MVREAPIDLLMLGRPALADPRWPVWTARKLGHASPFSLAQQDWRWWLENVRGHAPSIGWPEVRTTSPSSGLRDTALNESPSAVSAPSS